MKNKNKWLGIIAIATIIAVLLVGCNDTNDTKNNGETPSTFKAVTNITGIPSLKQTDVNLTLTGTVVPNDATNKTIVWSIADDDNGSAEPSLAGNVLTTGTEGTVKLLATIANGLTETTPYTQPFTITVTDDEVTGGCECDDPEDCDGDCCAECECEPDTPTPTYLFMVISQDISEVILGVTVDNVNFMAEVIGLNLTDEHKIIRWEILTEGTASGTAIVSTGDNTATLWIAPNESSPLIQIIAISTFFNKSASGGVVEIIFPPPPPTIDSITITPNVINVARGFEQHFFANVTINGSIITETVFEGYLIDVYWVMETNVSSPYTTLSSSPGNYARLLICLDETTEEIVIRARLHPPFHFEHIFGEAIITVIDHEED
ncbi:MAG: hypothetical protein FWD36_10290 [Treponema sp.]|nr:hypothetical protein [Treponema sp.]